MLSGTIPRGACPVDMPVAIRDSHLLPECALYHLQHLFWRMIRVDVDVVPGRSPPRRQGILRPGSRRASQIDDQIREIRIPRSFGPGAGVEALTTLGRSIVQDDHAAATGAERLATLGAAPAQDQDIQLPGQPGRDPIHQGRALVLVFALEHDHQAAARECPPGNDQRTQDSPVESHRQPDDKADASSHDSAGRGIRAIRAERRGRPRTWPWWCRNVGSTAPTPPRAVGSRRDRGPPQSADSGDAGARVYRYPNPGRDSLPVPEPLPTDSMRAA